MSDNFHPFSATPTTAAQSLPASEQTWHSQWSPTGHRAAFILPAGLAHRHRNRHIEKQHQPITANSDRTQRGHVAQMTQTDTSLTWFLAQMKPNSHQIARRNLERQGFDVFLPLHQETVRRGGHFKTLTKPLFPGYIFVGWSPGATGWQSVNATQGITKLVAFGRDPAPVPTGIVDALMQRDAEAGAAPPALEQGDRVRVATGPFVDFIAQVDTISADQRVWLLLDLMGRKTRISTDRQDLHRTK